VYVFTRRKINFLL
ncbi:30S ribosomal protein S8, partial [Vibrio harveyi]